MFENKKELFSSVLNAVSHNDEVVEKCIDSCKDAIFISWGDRNIFKITSGGKVFEVKSGLLIKTNITFLLEKLIQIEWEKQFKKSWIKK